MGRIRTIKPEFWIDEKVGGLKRDERLLFLGLLNLADDEGVLKAAPAFIKGQIFAYDEDLSVTDIKEWLVALVGARVLVSFDYNNEKYFLIRTFKSHQKINRPTPSKIPVSILENVLNEGALNDHGVSGVHSLPERNGRERNREIERKGKEEEIPLFLSDNGISDKIMKFFHFTDEINTDKLKDIGSFLNCLLINNRHQYFQDQFDAYVEYKEINNSYVHTFRKFLGTHPKLFEDGAWNAENWTKKLETEKNKLNGKIIQTNTGHRSAQAILTAGDDDSDL